MPLVDLLEHHHRFAEVLARVRGCAHRRQLRGAAAGLQWLEQSLRSHINFEETELLPRFAELDHPVPNGAPAVFQRDHRLILEAFEALHRDWEEPVQRAERLGELAGLLEHHDLREARYFKPRLDEALDPALMQRLLTEHLAQVEALGSPPQLGGPSSESAEPPELPPMQRLRYAVAVGDGPGALAALSGIQAELQGGAGSKAQRQVQRLEAALHQQDWASSWDRLRLFRAALHGQQAVR